MAANIAGVQAWSDNSSECTTKEDFKKFFEENWPKMVYEGTSFPLHDDIAHSSHYLLNVLKAKRTDFVRHIKPNDTPQSTECDSDLQSVWVFNEKMARRTTYRRKKKGVLLERKLKVDKNKIKMKPHSSEDGTDEEDDIEGIFSTLLKFYAMYQAQNSYVTVSLVLDLLWEHIPRDICNQLKLWVLHWKETLEELTLENMVDKMKLCLSNWKLFESGHLFSMFKELFNLIGVLMLTPSEFIPKLLENKDKFFKYLESIREQSTDVISWVMKTLAAILESVKKYRETGDVISSFCMVTPFQQICAIYDRTMRVYVEVYNGIDSRTDVGEYFEKEIAELELLMPSLNMTGASKCASFVSRLKVCKQKLLARIAGKEDNIQGFAVALTGSTGCGKTNLANVLLPYLLKVNGFPHTRRHIVTPNLNSKHWDNVSNDTFGMRFDDPDFMKPEFIDTQNHYITKIGRVLNNAAFFFEMADLEEKGAIICQVLVALLTSNSTEYGVDIFATEPSAIHRRIQYHVDIAAKKEYCKVNADGSHSTIIDPDKVIDAFGADDLFPDIFNINIFECQVLPSQSIKRKVSFDHPAGVHQTDKYCFAHSQWVNPDGEDVRMQDVNINTFLQFMVERSKAWFRSQKVLLERNKLTDTMELCEGCDMTVDNCTCYEDELFGTSTEGTGVLEEDYEVPTPDLEETAFDGLRHGRNPDENAPSGEYPCVVCNRGYSPEGLWVYKDGDNVSKGVCRRCLATTRLNCNLCENLASSELGMRRNPVRYIRATDYCKCGIDRRTPSGMNPHSSFIDGDWVRHVADMHMKVSDSRGKMEFELRDVVKKVLNDVNVTVNSELSFLDGHVQTETSKFIKLLIRKFCRWARKNRLTDLGTWIPLEYEGTEVGAYLHSMTNYSQIIKRTDRIFSTLSLGLAIVGYVNINPFALYRVIGGLWLDKNIEVDGIKPKYPWRENWFGREIPRYENVSFDAPLERKSNFRLIKESWTLASMLCKTKAHEYGFKNRLCMMLPLCYCAATKGRPVSKMMSLTAEFFPAFTKKTVTFLDRIRRKVFFQRTYVMNRQLLGIATLGIARYSLPLSLIIGTGFFILNSDFFLDRSHSFDTGKVLSDTYKIVKEGHTGTIETFRDDVLGPTVLRTVCARLCYIVADAAWSFRARNGLNPQASNISIQDYSSLSGMSKYYFKKEWSNLNLDPLPVKKKSTPGELLNCIPKNLLVVVNEGRGIRCCAWALKSKLILIPRHFISEKRVTYTFKRKDDIGGLCGNAKTKVKFSAKDAINVAEDLCVVELPSLGDFSDLTDYFMENLDRIPLNGVMITRNFDGIIVSNSVEDITYEPRTESGLKRDGKTVSWKGLYYVSAGVANYTCMSPIVSIENPSAILGFHLGGNSRGLGCSSLHNRDDIEGFKAKFTARESFVDAPNSGDFQTQMYGKTTVIQGIHPNAVAAALDEGEYKLFGSTGEVIRDNTDVIDTPIAEGIYKNFNIGDRWGPPNLKGTYSVRGRKEKWLYTANQFATPKDLFPVDLLERAFRDYTYDLEKFVESNPPEIARPLTYKETVSGIDGCDFISQMDPTTAVGFPLAGPKSRYMESYDDEGITRNRFTTDIFDKQSVKIRTCYRRGVRTYPVSKTFVKNEPTFVTKEKCRLVNGAPLHFQMVVRRVALPLAKYMCDHPDRFECSVGVVPYGHCWQHMFDRLMCKGNRIIAADYKGYDMNTGSQMIFAAFAVLIRIAKLFGFHDDDVNELRCIAADVAWPVVDLNGDIVMYFGGTVSGHTLTSIVNSIINSLYLRMAYYDIYPNGQIVRWNYRFQEICSLYVYGDDLIGAVALIAMFFNNRSIANVMGKYGLVMTPFDKKGTMRRYDDIWSVEFLKRSFRKLKKVGIVGPLNEKSILKRLASVHKPRSPNTMYTLLPDNIEGAMIEWFYMGEWIYNSRRKLLRRIVLESGDDLLVTACQRPLGVTYKARMRTWQSLYSA